MSRFELSLLARDEAERRRFLTVLSETGTIRAAALRTGVSVSTVARLRTRDAGFAAACAAVIGDPAAHALQAALLGRLTNGTERRRKYADGREETWQEFNDVLAWTVLKRLWPDKYGEVEPTSPAAPPPAAPPERPQMTRAEFVAAVIRRDGPRLALGGGGTVCGEGAAAVA